MTPELGAVAGATVVIPSPVPGVTLARFGLGGARWQVDAVLATEFAVRLKSAFLCG